MTIPVSPVLPRPVQHIARPGSVAGERSVVGLLDQPRGALFGHFSVLVFIKLPGGQHLDF